jgi:deoxyribose-phosphate aldolase
MLKLETFIDQTLLKPEATSARIEELCRGAVKYGFKTVFINPAHIERACELLKDSDTLVGSVCGFPLGADRTEVKVYEAETNENLGAAEIDMVANIGAIKDGDYEFVKADIAAVRKSLVGDTILKVILECTLLTDDEIENAAIAAMEGGADFVKTSTGFFGGATTHHVSLLYQTVGMKIGVKASGGIRDVKTMLAMIEAGASRIGTSSGEEIMDEYLSRK